MVDKELPKYSLGLEVLGADVVWGNWQVATPQGQANIASFAIVTAVRAAGSGGEVLLGNIPPITNSHVLSGPWPSEAEVRAGLTATCDALRAFITQQRAPQNGQGIPRGPIADIMRRGIRDNPQA
jgi:hypothetical protein